MNVVRRYFRRDSRSGQFQFTVRSVLALTFAAAVVSALLTRGLLGFVMALAFVGGGLIYRTCRQFSLKKTVLGIGCFLPLIVVLATSRVETSDELRFSPDAVSHCQRTYHTRVWGDAELWVSSVIEKDLPTALERYLRDAGFVGSRPAHGSSELLTWTSRSSAKVLCDCFDCDSGRSNEWVNWSRQNPQEAAVLWPKIVALIRQRRYDDVRSLAASVVRARSSANADVNGVQQEKRSTLSPVRRDDDLRWVNANISQLETLP